MAVMQPFWMGDPDMKKEKTNKSSAMLVSTDMLGERIKLARSARNITQSELAKKVGTVYQRVHEWESSWKNPSDKYLDKIADTLDVDVEWLKTGDYAKEPYCVYAYLSQSKKDCLSEAEFRNRKNYLTKAVDYILTVDNDTLGKVDLLVDTGRNAEVLKKEQSERVSEYFNRLSKLQ